MVQAYFNNVDLLQKHPCCMLISEYPYSPDKLPYEFLYVTFSRDTSNGVLHVQNKVCAIVNICKLNKLIWLEDGLLIQSLLREFEISKTFSKQISQIAK